MYFKDKEKIFSRRKRKMLRKRLVYLTSLLKAQVGAALAIVPVRYRKAGRVWSGGARETQ